MYFHSKLRYQAQLLFKNEILEANPNASICIKNINGFDAIINGKTGEIKTTTNDTWGININYLPSNLNFFAFLILSKNEKHIKDMFLLKPECIYNYLSRSQAKNSTKIRLSAIRKFWYKGNDLTLEDIAYGAI